MRGKFHIFCHPVLVQTPVMEQHRRIASRLPTKFRKKEFLFSVIVFVTSVPALSKAQCFGGVETYEKTSGVAFGGSGNVVGLVSQPGTAVTRDCAALCKQTSTCAAFTVDYGASRCQSVDQDFIRRKDSLKETSGINYFQKICLRGVKNYNTVCGDRLWAFERVIGASLQGFDDLEEINVQSRADCQRICLEQTDFVCRSAEYDASQQICRLSREDRRTQPLAFRKDGGSTDYLENQCVRMLPDCRYAARNDASLFSMDQVEFAQSQNECESLCDQARAFHCRAYSFISEENRCYLSGDDSVSLLSVQLRNPQGPPNSRQKSVYAEKICSISQCENGIFTYEKVTGHILRSARQESLSLTGSRNTGTDSMTGGVTVDCGKACLEIGADCPAFHVDYTQGRCFKLDRNSQGRAEELTLREGNSYFEKICLRGNVAACRDRAWAFDRIPGKELRGLDNRVLPLVATRRDCQEACLQETQFVCRSAEYDTKSLDCRLSSADRRSRPEAYTDAAVHVEYLENQCLQLDPSCTFQVVENAYPRYLDAIVSNIQDEKLCAASCNSHRPFICRSYSYYQSGSQCFLSGDDRVSASTLALQMRQGTNYTERKCSSNLQSPGISQNSGSSFGSGFGGFNSFFTPSWSSPSGSGSGFGPGSGSFTFRSPGTTSGFQLGTLSGSFSTALPFNTQDRCRGGRMHFQRSTGYEAVSTSPGSFRREGSVYRLYPMVINNRGSPTLRECMNQCGSDPHCMGFTFDPRRQSCTGIEGDLLSTANNKNVTIPMRKSTGIVTYEANCFRASISTCSSMWSTERLPGFDLRGFDREIIRGITRSDCMERCLEERRFVCRAAIYENGRQECRLSSEDRFTQPRSFQANPDCDYIENQCAPEPRNCRFGQMQMDKSLLYVDKTLNVISEAECQNACLAEQSFLCRSLSMQRETRSPGLCSLSSTISTQTENTQFQRGAVYTEKSCDPLAPSSNDIRPVNNEIFPTINRNPVPRPIPDTSGGLFPTANRNPVPRPIADTSGGWTSLSNGGKSPSGGSNPFTSNPNIYPYVGLHSSPAASDPFQQNSNRYPNDPLYQNRFSTSGGVRNVGFGPGGSGSGIITSVPISFENGYGNGYGNGYRNDYGNGLNAFDIRRCRGATTYDKVANADYIGARRQEIRLPNDGSFTMDCLRECDRMGERCVAVVMETDRSPRQLFSSSSSIDPTSSRQKCYVLDRSASMDSTSLQYASYSMYFEKVCLPEASCGKPWSFVRVHGYELEGFDNQILRNINSKEECQAACLREPNGQCRSAEYFPRERSCHISTENRRTQIRRFRASGSDVVYMENQCASEPPHCEYADQEGRMSPWFDRMVTITSGDTSASSMLSECRRLCDTERNFLCKSVSMQISRPVCFLSSDDSISLNGINGANALMPQRDFVYSERASCSNVRVECTHADIIVTLSFGYAFNGRVYASGNPQACFEMGSGRDQMTLRIPLGNQCGTIQQAPGRYANHIVIQQNAIIMQESDRTVRVECSFDAAEQTVTFAQSSGQRIGGLHYPGAGGLDVTIPFRPGSLNIVTNTAPTPAVRMRITSQSGQEARVVGLGEPLTLRIEVDPLSAFGITARNLEARTDNGELLTLIEATGCPRDSNIFPALSLDRGSKSLYADFKAFRFPSTATVNFVATVTFCQDTCQPVRCPDSQESYGRKRREANTTDEIPTVPTTEESTEPETAANLRSSSSYLITETTTATTTTTTTATTTTTENEELVSTVPVPTEIVEETYNTSPTTVAVQHTPDTTPSSRRILPEVTPELQTENTILPVDIPLSLQLIVGPEAVPVQPRTSPFPQKHQQQGEEHLPLFPDPAVEQRVEALCNTKSVLTATICVSLLINVGLITGFIWFYRRKSLLWNKGSGVTQNPVPHPVPVRQSGTLSEVTFRNVYDNNQQGTWNTLNLVGLGNNRRCHVASVFPKD